MRKEKVLAILTFLSLVADNEGVLAYYNELWTPGRLLEWLTWIMPIKFSIFQILIALLLIVARKNRKATVAEPIRRAVRASFVTLLLCITFGLATGGETKPIFTQASAWVHCLIFSMAATAIFTKAEDFQRVNTAIVYAAVWRACIAIIFYMKVRDRAWNLLPAYMTTHEDTVLFVVGLLILISRAIEFRTKQARRWLYFAAPIILAGIQFNNRRLAWASLGISLMILYFMLPTKSKVTRKVNRVLLLAAPLVVVYAVVGWGREEKIFKPLLSFSTMVGGKIDPSTKARDNENMGLVIMIKERPILGTGLGHQWLEVDPTYTVSTSVFPMYHYCPHNSVLALFAFCGCFGFAGLWMIIPIAVFLQARTCRIASLPAERHVAVIGLVEIATYLNQSYGDMGAMGVTHISPATLLGLSIASAARLSVSSGAWSVFGKSRISSGDAKSKKA